MLMGTTCFAKSTAVLPVDQQRVALPETWKSSPAPTPASTPLRAPSPAAAAAGTPPHPRPHPPRRRGCKAPSGHLRRPGGPSSARLCSPRSPARRGRILHGRLHNCKQAWPGIVPSRWQAATACGGPRARLTAARRPGAPARAWRPAGSRAGGGWRPPGGAGGGRRWSGGNGGRPGGAGGGGEHRIR